MYNDLSLADVHLGGATVFCSMPDDVITGACVFLTKCHPHHFAVCTHGGRRGMLISETAYQCLKDTGIFDATPIRETQWTP